MRSRPPETGLHFIRDAHAASRARMFIRVLKITIGEHHYSAHALDGFRDKSGDPARRGKLDQLLHVRRVLFPRVGIVAAPSAAIRVGRCRVMRAETVRDIELPV